MPELQKDDWHYDIRVISWKNESVSIKDLEIRILQIKEAVVVKF